MSNDIVDASKINPEDIIDAEYDDIPEERRKQFETQLKKEQEEATRRLLACYERTRQGVVQKEDFIVPPNPSTSTTSNVSIDPANFINQLLDALGKRIEKSTRDFAIRINNQLQASSKGEGVDHSYSTETLNPSSSAASAFISQPFYSMLPNYFAGQSPSPRSTLPNMAEPVRPM